MVVVVVVVIAVVVMVICGLPLFHGFGPLVFSYVGSGSGSGSSRSSHNNINNINSRSGSGSCSAGNRGAACRFFMVGVRATRSLSISSPWAKAIYRMEQCVRICVS